MPRKAVPPACRNRLVRRVRLYGRKLRLRVVHAHLGPYHLFHLPIDPWRQQQAMRKHYTYCYEARELLAERMTLRGRNHGNEEMAFAFVAGADVALLGIIGISNFIAKPLIAGLICGLVLILPRIGEILPKRNGDEEIEALETVAAWHQLQSASGGQPLHDARLHETASRSHAQRAKLRLVRAGKAVMILGMVVSLTMLLIR